VCSSDLGVINLNQDIYGEHRVDVKNDNYETIKSFVFEFDGSAKNYFKYVLKCFVVAPQRFLKGYWDNYKLLCDMAERPLEEGIIRYQTGPVNRIGLLDILLGNIGSIDKTAKWNISNENRNAAIEYLRCQFDSDLYIDTYKQFYFYTDRMEKFKTSFDKSIVAEKMANEIWANVHLFLYAFITITALPMFLFAFIMIILKKRSESLIAVYLLSGFTFAHTMMLVMTGCVVDRYMFPAYIAKIIACFFVCLWVNDFFIKTKRKWCNK